MVDHADLVRKSESIFPDSKTVYEAVDTYDQAKGRLLQCIREGAPSTPQVDRWALACEAAALAREEHEEPYKGWAQRLIDTDLKNMIYKFLSAGADPLEDTADPLMWQYRPIVCREVRRLIPIFAEHNDFLGDPDDFNFPEEAVDDGASPQLGPPDA